MLYATTTTTSAERSAGRNKGGVHSVIDVAECKATARYKHARDDLGPVRGKLAMWGSEQRPLCFLAKARAGLFFHFNDPFLISLLD